MSEAAPIPVIVHLSGARRGTTQRLRGDRLRIGTGPEAEIHVAHEPSVASHHASLERKGATYELVAEPQRPVWVNGRPADHQTLVNGDVLEVGLDGPILRFRLYPPGSKALKTAAEAFSDCIDCAKYSYDHPIERAAAVLSGAPREMTTQTSIGFRLLMLLAILGLVVGMVVLGRSQLRLAERLEEEEMRVQGIEELVSESENRLSMEDLQTVRGELGSAVERVEALEARTGAPARVVAEASRSVVFLQGAYGFIEPTSGEPLRFIGIEPDGLPVRDDTGSPLVGIGGSGPVLEAFFTGTGFVVTEDGLLLTNRHVALPWDYDEAARLVVSQGLAPQMRRFVGFLPGVAEAFDVELLQASDDADLAVLQCGAPPGRVPPLALGEETALAGDEVLVLGYPTGIRALLARADESFVDQLTIESELDYWAVAQRLANAGHIAPLASRGIVAQVSEAAVVYDAETTSGGSGGPVLDFDGRVVAITSAIVPEFGGSNLGVPAPRAVALLLQIQFERMAAFHLR